MKYDKFFAVAKEIYKDEPSGHDFSHIERVLSYCKTMLEKEGGDEEIVIISALFHDLHRVLSSKKGHFISSEEAMPYVREVLSQFDLEKEKLDAILFVIEQHDNKKKGEGKPLELQIILDADILDSLGKVGLTRTLTYCKRYNIPLTDKRFSLDCEEYIPDVNPISTVHYITRTMIPNKALLNTKTAKEIGQGLAYELETFVQKTMKEA